MDFITFFVGIILTAIIYMAFPLIRLLINGKRFSPKRARRIALWNSIVLGFFFFVLTIAVYGDGTLWNAAPAFLYCAINTIILTDKNAEETQDKRNKQTSSKPSGTTPMPKKTSDVRRPPQISDPNEPQKSYGNFSVPCNDLAYIPQNISKPIKQSPNNHSAPSNHTLNHTKVKNKSKNKLIIVGIIIAIVLALISVLIVYMVSNNDTEIYNVGVRTVSFSDEFTAEFVLELWLLGDATEETMVNLMNEYGAEQGGGKLYIITPGEFVEEIDEWCFSKKRKAGDYAIIESVYGYTLCYFSGQNLDE